MYSTRGTQAKIPCSVSLLTLNSAKGLPTCLRSLRDFAEIIVCDGNSTDGTQSIARKAGARVISQYDTDEPLTPCAMDKAAVRERAMAASTLPWRFFMDSDDELSPEVVEEIRSIVSHAAPSHFVWRMPTRIFLGGETLREAREILHEASYPSYQTRLVHESVQAHFRGKVHDRLVFDEQKFPAGTMKGFYNFHWPEERVKNYWRYLSTYAGRELETSEYPTLGNLLYWGVYRRLRTILGYVFWRLPSLYIRHGFKDSMPLSLELMIVGYHLMLFFGAIGKYMATRKWWIFLRELSAGESFSRTRANLALSGWEAYGRVLDVGRESSHSRFLKMHRWHVQTSLPSAAETFPYADGHFDTVIVSDLRKDTIEARFREARRVLKQGGAFIARVPEKILEENLRALLVHTGFEHADIVHAGGMRVFRAY